MRSCCPSNQTVISDLDRRRFRGAGRRTPHWHGLRMEVGGARHGHRGSLRDEQSECHGLKVCAPPKVTC